MASPVTEPAEAPYSELAMKVFGMNQACLPEDCRGPLENVEPMESFERSTNANYDLPIESTLTEGDSTISDLRALGYGRVESVAFAKEQNAETLATLLPSARPDIRRGRETNCTHCHVPSLHKADSNWVIFDPLRPDPALYANIEASGTTALNMVARQAYVRPNSTRYLEFNVQTASVRSRHIAKLADAGVTVSYTGTGPHVIRSSVHRVRVEEEVRGSTSTLFQAAFEAEDEVVDDSSIESTVAVKIEDMNGDGMQSKGFGDVDGGTESKNGSDDKDVLPREVAADMKDTEVGVDGTGDEDDDLDKVAEAQVDMEDTEGGAMDIETEAMAVE